MRTEQDNGREPGWPRRMKREWTRLQTDKDQTGPATDEARADATPQQAAATGTRGPRGREDPGRRLGADDCRRSPESQGRATRQGGVRHPVTALQGVTEGEDEARTRLCSRSQHRRGHPRTSGDGRCQVRTGLRARDWARHPEGTRPGGGQLPRESPPGRLQHRDLLSPPAGPQGAGGSELQEVPGKEASLTEPHETRPTGGQFTGCPTPSHLPSRLRHRDCGPAARHTPERMTQGPQDTRTRVQDTRAPRVRDQDKGVEALETAAAYTEQSSSQTDTQPHTRVGGCQGLQRAGGHEQTQMASVS